jgi:hypothetical protein
MFYLTNRYTPGKLPKDEPVHQFIPLVEFAFDTPRGEKTAATMNPGLAYVADAWQVPPRPSFRSTAREDARSACAHTCSSTISSLRCLENHCSNR